MKNFIVLSGLTFFLGCVPLQQQVADGQGEDLDYYELVEITIDSAKFIKTLNPEDLNHDLKLFGDEIKTYPELLKSNFQSDFSISGVGEINAGQLTRQPFRTDDDPFVIVQDYLMFTIDYGGGGHEDLISYDLIWNGKYYLTDDGPTVDLVLSFKDLDIHRAMIYKDLRVDLTPLQTNQSSYVNINFLGYHKTIKYQYQGY